MKYLLKKSNTAINSDHIVKVVYSPATEAGFDQDEHVNFPARKSECEITLTTHGTTGRIGYEGVYEGEMLEPRTIELRGESADAFWEVYIASDCYAVLA